MSQPGPPPGWTHGSHSQPGRGAVRPTSSGSGIQSGSGSGIQSSYTGSSRFPAQRRAGRVPGRIAEFVILEPIGAGGMGQVFRAHPEGSPDRQVALKLGPVEAGQNPRKLERFRREGEITAALRHPHIVPVHAAGVTPDGRPYLAYHLVEGAQTFDRAVEHWDLRQRVQALRDVARALGFAHQRGIVHRDVKPENVLVSADDTVLLADFGLANTEALDRITRSQVLLGTPLYMAPEIATQGTRGTCPQSDVYALGVMLYELLTGQHPYADKGMQAVVDPSLRRVAAPQGDDVPAALATVTLHALALDPAQRYADGDALADDLDAWLEGRAVAAARRAKAPWALAFVALTALAGVGVWLTRHAAPAEPARATASETPAEPSPAATPTPSTRPPRTPEQDAALAAALDLLDLLAREPAAVTGDAELIGALNLLDGALDPDEPEAKAVADGVFAVLADTSVDWHTWGCPVLAALAQTGARPSARRQAEAMVETIYWGQQWQKETFTQDDAIAALVSLIELDVDLAAMNHYYDGIPSLADAESAPDATRRYLVLRVRLRKSKWLPVGDPTYAALLELGDDPTLGPTTRARALAEGVRALTDPAARLPILRRARELDPNSPVVALHEAHALLEAGEVDAGLTALDAAWPRWAQAHRGSDSATHEEAYLLTESLRQLLRRDLVDQAQARVESYAEAYLPMRPKPLAQVRAFVDRYVKHGKDDPVVAHWLETNTWKPGLAKRAQRTEGQ